MKKTVILCILGVAMLIAVLGGVKGLQIKRMIAQGEQFVPPPETVTASMVQSAAWPSELIAVGSLEAVQGVLRGRPPGRVTASRPNSPARSSRLPSRQDVR